jgi:hypothetical protein
MRTKTKTAFKVDTWLPIFSGFYGTIWEADSDEENEMFGIDQERKSKGLPPVEYDDIEWDYDEYREQVTEGMTREIEVRLKEFGLVDRIKFQKLSSPREYNFANDSIHVEMTLTNENVEKILDYIHSHYEAFSKYIVGRYTSYDGFISSHSNDPYVWKSDIRATLADTHKLGAVLDFILRNEDEDMEMDIYEDLHGNGAYLYASNYEVLIGGK